MASVLSPILRPVSSGLRGPALWLRWAGFTAMGELVGFAAPALAGVLITRAVAGLDGAAGPLLTLLALLAAGGLEGAALGYAQWLVLRRVIPTILWRAWTGATAGAGLLGLAATFGGAALIDAATPAALAVAIGVASGALMGLVVGLVTGALLVNIADSR